MPAPGFLRGSWGPLPRVVWALLALAFAVRLGVVIATPHYTPGADAFDYHRHALSIAAGNGYPESRLVDAGGPTAFRPPGYSYLLGFVYFIFGHGWFWAGAAQALLGTVVVALVGVICLQVWGERVAAWAMGVAAVYPPLVVLGAALLSEPLFLVFELGAIAAALQHRRAPRGIRWVAAAGALVGLATLTRVNGALLVIPLGIYLWGRPAARWTSVAVPAALVAVAVLVVAPWTIRNEVVLHHFIPVSTQDDFALERNYNALAENASPPSTPRDTPQILALIRQPGIDEAEAASRAGSDGRSYALHHLGYVAETVGRNLVRMFHLSDIGLARTAGTSVGIDRTLVDIGIYSFYPFALLALCGALLPIARRAPWVVWVAPLLALAPALLIAAGRTRYRAPIDPLIAILAALALAHLWSRKPGADASLSGSPPDSD